MGRLLGDLGAAHPPQGHMSQERRYASPSFRRQHVPNRRRQIAHRGIQANGPKRIALQTRFSAIRCVPSIYERYCEWDIDIEIRQIKYLNNIVEQDHRAVKRVARPMLGFKSFRSAAVTVAGIELMHMIRKGQLRSTGKLRPAQQFYALAA